jgi:hypothetical protein
MAIIINNERNEKRALIAEKFTAINAMHREIETLEDELRLPVEWYEQTAMRIILDNNSIVLLTINAKALIDYIFASDITVEKVDAKSYIYVSYINEAHEPILVGFGAVIETNENI